MAQSILIPPRPDQERAGVLFVEFNRGAGPVFIRARPDDLWRAGWMPEALVNVNAPLGTEMLRLLELRLRSLAAKAFPDACVQIDRAADLVEEARLHLGEATQLMVAYHEAMAAEATEAATDG